MGQMQITEETPTKMTINMKASDKLRWHKPVRSLITPVIFLGAAILINKFFNGSLSFLMWVVIVLVVLIEILIVCFYLFLRESDTIVVFDLALRRATRIDTYLFIRKKKIELSMEQINRVLIEVGHSNTLKLESTNDTIFIIDFGVDPHEELGRKLGRFIGKPAVIKYPNSEEAPPI